MNERHQPLSSRLALPGVRTHTDRLAQLPGPK